MKGPTGLVEKNSTKRVATAKKCEGPGEVTCQALIVLVIITQEELRAISKILNGSQTACYLRSDAHDEAPLSLPMLRDFR